MENRQILKYTFIGGIVAGALVAVLLLTRGCGKEEKVVEMGPGDTVEAFCRAVAGGDFESAMPLCDTMNMKTYIERYAEAWRMQEKKDSSIVSIAGATLEAADISIEDIVKEGDRRQVLYTIKAGEGLEKKKTATVRKEEGVWKVEEITDRN